MYCARRNRRAFFLRHNSRYLRGYKLYTHFPGWHRPTKTGNAARLKQKTWFI